MEKKPKAPEERPQSYIATVDTCNEPGAGTDANVYITMFGALGHSERTLLNEDPDNFSIGASNVFALESKAVGKVQRVRLEIDHAGGSCAWKVARVSIQVRPFGPDLYIYRRFFSPFHLYEAVSLHRFFLPYGYIKYCECCSN